MPQAASRLARDTAVPGIRSRKEKLTLAISVVAFFAAIGVVVWFSLTSIGAADEPEDTGDMIIFAGGSPAQVTEEVESDPVAESGAVDDGYVIGNFGDPVADLYADDDDGGWGEPALDNAS